MRDRVSFFMVRAREGANVDSVLHLIERAVPRVSVVSTETAMRQVDERLSYFRQLAFILGAVSLAVGFLLVTTLVTVSVNERLGEIVVAVLHPAEDQVIDEPTLRTFLDGKLAAYKIPERMIFSDEPLPRLGTGKIDRVALKQKYAN